MAINPDARETCLNSGGIDLNFYLDFGGADLNDQNSELCVKTNIDCKLLKNLAEADAAGNNDGCVTPDDVQKKFAKFSPAQIDRVFMGYRFRADNLDTELQALVVKEASLADSSALNRAIVWEAKQDVVRIETSRIDVLEELTYVAAFGYYARDHEMAQGGVTTLWDIMSFPRKLAFWQDSNSMRDLFEEWGESRLSDRTRAFGKFIELLRDCVAQNVGAESVNNAVSALGSYHYQDNGNEMCNGWFGSLFFDCGDKIINDDLPVHLVEELIAVKKSDALQMAKTLYKMGVWFEEKNNWIAAQYIFEQLVDNGHRAGFEKIAQDSKSHIHQIVGKIEDSPFLSALLPPMPWEYNELSARDRYNFGRDWASFGLSWYGASLAVSGARNALGAASAVIVSKSKWLQKLIAANAKYGHGAAANRAAGSTLEGTGMAVAAAGAEAAVPTLGKFGQTVAQVLDKTGRSLYAPFGAIKKMSSYAAAGAAVAGKAVSEGMTELAASSKLYVSLPAKIINLTAKESFEFGRFVLVNGAKTIKTLGKGANAFGGYLAVRAYGNPLLPYPYEFERDVATEPFRKYLGDYEMDWAIEMALNEAKHQKMPSANMVFVIKMERAEWEMTRRAQKRCDLGLPGTPEACQLDLGLDFDSQASAGFVRDVISNDPLLSQLQLGFFGEDGITTNVASGGGFLEYSKDYQLQKTLGPQQALLEANGDLIIANSLGGAGFDLSLEKAFGLKANEAVFSPEDIFGPKGSDFAGEEYLEFESYRTYAVEMADGNRYVFVVGDKLDAKMRAIAGEEYLTGAFNI